MTKILTLRVSQVILSAGTFAILCARMRLYHHHMVMAGVDPYNPYIIANCIIQVVVWWGLILYATWFVLPTFHAQKGDG